MSSNLRRRKGKKTKEEPTTQTVDDDQYEDDISLSKDLDEDLVGSVDLYGEADTNWGKGRKIAGMILGDSVASSFFGDLNVVTVDYSKYKERDDLQVGSPASVTSAEEPLTGTDDTEVENDALQNIGTKDVKNDINTLDKIFCQNKSDVGYAYAKELSCLHMKTKSSNLKELALSIHTACSQLEQGQGKSELEVDTHTSIVIGMLADSCRELSDELTRLEYELKRLAWRKPAKSNGSGHSTLSSNQLTTTPHAGSVKSNYRADGTSSEIQPFKNSEEEELWVMDQLDAMLSRSRSVPGIFWKLLEERQIALGMKSSGEDGLWQENPWQLTTLGSLFLAFVGCLWAIPALYQRLGTPFLFATALFFQIPLLVFGTYFWADDRTASLGGIIVTIGASLTSYTVLSFQALCLSLGLYKGMPRDWYPEPFDYLQDLQKFPTNSRWVFGCTAFVSLFTFLLVADVPWLAYPLVLGIRFAIVYSPTLRYLELLLNHYVIGPGKLGLHQADVWIDLLLGILLLCGFVILLVFNWLFSSPIKQLPEASPSNEQSIVTGSSATALSISDQTNNQSDVESFAQKKKRNNYREFLAIGCDVSIVLFWISFSRIEKSHSTELEMIYGSVNCLLVVLALLSKRRTLLIGLFGLGWYQGYRVVDVFNRSKHYAKSLLLYDDFCVLIRCVDPFKSRPDW